jgi:hypothetical protein
LQKLTKITIILSIMAYMLYHFTSAKNTKKKAFWHYHFFFLNIFYANYWNKNNNHPMTLLLVNGKIHCCEYFLVQLVTCLAANDKSGSNWNIYETKSKIYFLLRIAVRGMLHEPTNSPINERKHRKNRNEDSHHRNTPYKTLLFQQKYTQTSKNQYSSGKQNISENWT